MKRRTVLKRAGATAAVGMALSGTATASSGGPERLDVSDVSGNVPLTELAEEPGPVAGTDPARVRVVVGEDTDEITTADIGCDLGCCCSAGSCPDGCDSCFCSVCGPGACDDDEPKVA